jgi:NitT/TauT family transport system permease protein
MTSAGRRALSRPAAVAEFDPSSRRLGRGQRALAIAGLIVLLLFIWEAAKWLGGDPWRLQGSILGVALSYEHHPPFAWPVTSDLALPHVWDIANAFVEPAQRGGQPLAATLVGAALFTFQEALVGFVIGALLGLGLGILFVHAPRLERAFVPYVVASQMIPIVAIAPLVVIFLRVGWLSVAIIAAYLTFFPVTMAALRGLRAADPRALELMRSYAASRRSILWNLRLPTSVPYLFAAFRISASASVVGAIIGELPSGIPDGLGGAILNFKQYYVSGPEKLWATILVSALLGIVFVGLVTLAETALTRGRYRAPQT